MSGYLLDTNIISKFAPGKHPVNDNLAGWMTAKGAAGELYLSAMTIAEIERGMRKLYRAGGVDRARRLAVWLDRLVDDFGDHVLAMDTIVARVAGVMQDDATSRGHQPGLADIIIAATVQAYDLTLVTEDVKDFEPLGVKLESSATLGDG